MRKILTWLMTLISGWFLLLLYGSIGHASQHWEAANMRPSLQADVQLKALYVVISLGITWVLYKWSRRTHGLSSRDGESIELGAPSSPVGSAFDGASLGRHRMDIAESKPQTLRGRVREIRRWTDKSVFFPRETLGFHLDYDQTRTDYGDVLIRLRTAYFGRLRLQDGDEIEIDLKWKRRQQQGYVACVRNVTSGQLFKPGTVSSKAGTLEGIESGGR